MTRARRAAMIALLVAGCRRADTVVLVHVAAEPGVTAVRQVEAALTLGPAMDTRLFPEQPASRDLSFPTTFALLIPRARSGTLVLAVSGRGPERGETVARADGTTLELTAGKAAEVTVTLRPARERTADGGVVEAQANAPDATVIADATVAGDRPGLPADAAAPPDAPAPADAPRDVADDARPPDRAPVRRSVLMIVGDLALVPGDRAMRMRLEQRTFVVTVVFDAAITPAETAGKDLVLIAESVHSTDINTKLRDLPVPVLCTDALLFGDMAMTGPTADTDFGFGFDSQIAITNAVHPMAAGLTGTVTFATGGGKIAWGVPGAEAARVAALLGMPTRAAVFGYAAGAMMVGRPAPARRTGWFGSMNAAALTDAGWKLFDAAVDWTIGP